MTTEHPLPQSAAPEQRSQYGNCVNACRLCNRTRSNAPSVDTQGRRLLDPTMTAWAQHFTVQGDRLACCSSDDGDAHYTHEAYGLDDEYKVHARGCRARTIDECTVTLRSLPLLIDELDALAQHLPAGDRMVVLASIDRHRAALTAARNALRHHAVLPRDSNSRCRCGTTEHHTIPDWLESQTTEFTD